MSDEVVLVTGVSSGIGFNTALKLKEKGYIVWGAARRVENLKPLEEKGINIIYLDLCDENSIISCINEINQKSGGVDILINNAGYGSYGAIEDVEIEEAKRQFEVNIFGLSRMIQLVLPHMREKNKGKIINISSVGGKVHTPFGAWYHATKFALEALSDCLRIEVKEFNIDVVIIEPGAIKTDWGIIASDNLKKSSANSPYKKNASLVADNLKKIYSSEKGISDPSLVCSTIVKAVLKNKAKTRYLVGKNSKTLLFARRLLSDKLYDSILLKVFLK